MAVWEVGTGECVQEVKRVKAEFKPRRLPLRGRPSCMHGPIGHSGGAWRAAGGQGGRTRGRVAVQRVAAARVGPHPGERDLGGRPLLQQQLVLAVEKEDGEGAVQQAAGLAGLEAARGEGGRKWRTAMPQEGTTGATKVKDVGRQGQAWMCSVMQLREGGREGSRCRRSRECPPTPLARVF